MYGESIRETANAIDLRNVSILVTGATGLIGSCIIDTLLVANKEFGAGIKIYALSRSREKLEKRFGTAVIPIVQDIMNPLDKEIKYDYIIHGASNADPKSYATQPVETILTNIIGNKNILDYCVSHKEITKMILTSSFEVYGELNGQDIYSENMSGMIDQTILRNGYPESKRCGEALCQAYKSQKGLDVCIARLTRSYGPTMIMSDTKAVSQFIKKCIAGEDIVLKSEGTQYYSYTYTADAASGLLWILLAGENGEAYNIADVSGDITLRDLASIIAEINGKKVVFELPDAVEAAGYSKATKARLDGRKIRSLGWKPMYDIKTGMKRTIEILRSINGEGN